MIPKNYIDLWRKEAPWPDQDMVEQDLILSKVLVGIYKNDFLKRKLAFRGGTALYKLFVRPAARYSEDLDFIQIGTEPIKPVCDQIRNVLSWIDPKPSFKQKGDNFTFYFRYISEEGLKRKIKIEINCREHIAVFGNMNKKFEVKNPYFSNSAEITTFSLEELLASKLRALYQRRKGRDLFDLWYANENNTIDYQKILKAFPIYMSSSNTKVTSKKFKENLYNKKSNQLFLNDIKPLLNPIINYDQQAAFEWIDQAILEKMY